VRWAALGATLQQLFRLFRSHGIRANTPSPTAREFRAGLAVPLAEIEKPEMIRHTWRTVIEDKRPHIDGAASNRELHIP